MPVSQPSKCDSLHVIRLENIPWTATKREIVSLFGDIEILNGTNGIHFIVGTAKPHNDAFIQLVSKQDLQLAMNRKKLHRNHFRTDSN